MGKNVILEQVSEVGGGLVMKSFVSEKKDFKLNPLWGRKPVKLLEDRSDGHENERADVQQSSGCTGVYLGFWMMCDRECYCSS